MRVLIVKTSSMGDILHTLPSLTDAMRAIPNVNFDWVIEKNFAQIPYWHKAVCRVIPVAFRQWRKNLFSASTKAEFRAFYKTVKIVHYDAIIDSQGLVKSAALVTRITHGIKHGMDWQTVREPLASIFYNRRHHIAKQQHAVERIRELFAKSLDYPKPKTYGDYAISRYFINRSLQMNAPYLIFLHATTRNDKHWPEAHWRELINLLNASKLRIKLPWGIPYEKIQAKRIAKGFDYVDVLPNMDLNGIMEQITGAKAVVSVDTGLSHLTAALNHPNITLYGPTEPAFIGVYGKNQYICRSKHSSQMKDLSVATVFKQLKSLLATERYYI